MPKKKDDKEKKLSRKEYEKELAKLQIELVKLQEWIKSEELKVVVIFEGRDAAGKGGTIKRIMDKLNPRICRVVAAHIAENTLVISLFELEHPEQQPGRFWG